LNRGPWSPAEFERAIERLSGNRQLAIRQILLCYSERRIADEVTALEVLGRLATVDDAPVLASVTNDAENDEAARVACALVLLGQDRSALISAKDVSSLVLRWQARYVAEEPSLRAPLMKLFVSAPAEERASWIALQDRELTEAAGRAAVFEMLLEVEEEKKLRALILTALARVPYPETRACLRRIGGLSESEHALVAHVIASEPASETVPPGWSARVGFCDGTGSFPLRFDHRHPGRRPASAIFVLDLETGVREALALTGGEVERYDRQDADAAREDADDPSSTRDAAPGASLLPSIDVREALGLLTESERSTRRVGFSLPDDHPRARRLLDPLGDLRPLPRPSLAVPLVTGASERSFHLLDHPGYAGWFYDSGENVLDSCRVDVLSTCRPGETPGQPIVDRAAGLLAETGEPQRIVAMLRHNARVHEAAQERDLAAVALSTAAAIEGDGFARVPIVRRMISESLHPGHYFFTPLSEIPDRHDLACLVLGSRPPTKARVLAVDLAWTLSRAAEVWISRIPCRQRPTSDQIERTVLAAATRGARFVVRWARRADQNELRAGDFAGKRLRLAGSFRSALRDSGFPDVASDPGHARLVDMLVVATETLVFEVCLSKCPVDCPRSPCDDGTAALDRFDFPAGDDARCLIQRWPGTLYCRPNSDQEGPLREYLRALGLTADGNGVPAQHRAASFVCALCDDRRPVTARSRSVLGGDPVQAVCRRCQRRYLNDEAFRQRVRENLGSLTR
ncbi:MAG: hypothetical protein OEQ13_14615, partial [Acidobacteriota bacterium]|nr:hypothetical protein [Acidobacteriota bacterium]